MLKWCLTNGSCTPTQNRVLLEWEGNKRDMASMKKKIGASSGRSIADEAGVGLTAGWGSSAQWDLRFLFFLPTSSL